MHRSIMADDPRLDQVRRGAPAAWHLDARRSAGYRETGLLRRGGPDAAVIGVR
jgi:hypothetical protein